MNWEIMLLLLGCAGLVLVAVSLWLTIKEQRAQRTEFREDTEQLGTRLTGLEKVAFPQVSKGLEDTERRVKALEALAAAMQEELRQARRGLEECQTGETLAAKEASALREELAKLREELEVRVDRDLGEGEDRFIKGLAALMNYSLDQAGKAGAE